MFGKKYEKGMADATAIFEKFTEKQKEALEKIFAELKKGLCTLEEAKKRFEELEIDLFAAIEYLTKKEKEISYSISMPDDIKMLEKEEGILLIGALYQLAMTVKANQEQQAFVLSVQSYFGILECPDSYE